MPSAVSEHFSELLGCPISRSLAACCVSLKLRSLPSAGISRFPRYYEPPRLPKAPGLSLAGLRLIIPDHALGPPVLRTLSLCTCCRHFFKRAVVVKLLFSLGWALRFRGVSQESLGK